MIDPLVIVFGLGVGVLIGLTGIGGGTLMTPLLILFAGVLGSALGVVSKAGVDVPKWTIVAVPALVGLLAFAIVRMRGRSPEVEAVPA